MITMIQLNEKIIDKSAKICVIGLGYVGLPTSVFFADKGFNVIGVDIDKKKVEKINSGISPLKDLGLDEQVKRLSESKNLVASTSIADSVSKCDIVLIIVPTPVTEAKEPDLSYIVSAAEGIASSLRKDHLIVLESTTYPGTTEEVLKPILESTGLVAGRDFGLAYCPERYNPGDSNHTLENVARIVGGIDPQWGEVTRGLYQNIIRENVFCVKDIKTAEAAKVIENIQRDLNIALMNELALIFERMGIDIIDVIEAASTKWNFVKYMPGPGVGGHCLPVDPYYLTKRAQELGYHAQVILAGRKVNDEMPHHVFDMVSDGLNDVEKPVKGSNVVILGASYKANTADFRNSPSETLVSDLKKRGANVYIVEPNVELNEVFGCPCISVHDYLSVDPDCLVLMVAHREFETIDLLSHESDRKSIVFVDAARKYKSLDVTKAGFLYRAIGGGGTN
ncbi:nucleotide sugar dehydrogenase [Methanolobus psychrotolerans]|uniref:nucleotide sugar dehydrogenase n=1 Tax=Methanolobus psychrotolerans TaxID=1874706 RepID=UPI001A936B4E|nr:nucleotide sugar dehydrogenase [Methanolobus psychrotolerans]